MTKDIHQALTPRLRAQMRGRIGPYNKQLNDRAGNVRQDSPASIRDEREAILLLVLAELIGLCSERRVAHARAAEQDGLVAAWP